MSNQIVITSGAKVRGLNGVLTGTSGIVSSVPLGAANGVATLDSGGKVPVSQLPSSVVTYLGTWNAATNTPTLVNGVGDAGDMYICNVAGTVNFGAGPVTFAVGDWVLYGSGTWEKSNGQNGTVTSVAVTESGDSLNITGSPINTSGTINIGFNGTNLQYVNGAGNLTTFPDLSVYVTLAGTQTITGSKTFSSTALFDTSTLFKKVGSPYITSAGYTSLQFTASGTNTSLYITDGDSVTSNRLIFKNNAGYDYTFPAASGTIALTSDIPILTGYVPYTGATANVDLGTFNLTADVITGATGSFASSGGSDTFAINHSSGAGIALNITKGGNGEGLYINKTSGSGNAATIIGTLNATTLVKSGGTSSQFLKADGSVDSSTYALDSAVVHLAGTETITGAKTFSSAIKGDAGIRLKDGVATGGIGYVGIGSNAGEGLTLGIYNAGTIYYQDLFFPTTSGYQYTFPAASGTIALTSALANYVDLTTAQTIGGTKTFTDATKNNGGIFLQNASSGSLAGYMNLGGLTNGLKFTSGGGISNTFTLPSATGYTFTFPNATGTIALTSDIPSITGLVPYTGATSSVDLGLFSLTSNSIKVIGDNSTYGGTLSIKQSNVTSLIGVGYTELFGKTNRLGISFGAGSIALLSNSILTAERTYTLPDASGTVALTSDLTGGTVTSVAALTIGTSGTDLSSTVATSTTTPVITLNVPTASATNRGALSSADWTTFNNKQGTITLTTTGTSGAATFSSNTLNIPQYQGVLTNPVTGTGTTNYLPKFTGASTIGDSAVQDNGTLVTITSNTAGNSTLNLISSNSANSGKIQFGGATFGATIEKNSLGADSGLIFNSYHGGAEGYTFQSNGTNVMKLSASGNLGLGVTPSAWASGYKAFQIFTTSLFGTSSRDANFGANVFVNSSGNYAYTESSTASLYTQYQGSHSWYNAPSGTAGNAITFTQAMTLDASGNLSIGVTNPNTRLHIKGLNQTNGTVQFEPNAAKGLESSFIHYGELGDWYIRSASTSGRVIINDGGGNVLIGTTTNDTYKLDVNGTGRFSGNVNITSTTGNSAFIKLNRFSNTNSSDILFSTNGTDNWFMGTNALGTNLTDFYLYNYTTGSSNFSLSASTGAATFSSSVTAAAFTPSYNTSYFGTDGTISNYSAANYMYVNGTGGLRLKAEGVGYQKIVLEGSTSNDIWFTTANTERMRIASSGAITCTSSVTATGFFESSDSRLKTLIQDNYQTKGIASITPKLYTKNGKVELGYYAQDLVGILDSAISKGSDDMLSLSYREVHTAKIYALEQEIKELKAKMN